MYDFTAGSPVELSIEDWIVAEPDPMATLMAVLNAAGTYVRTELWRLAQATRAGAKLVIPCGGTWMERRLATFKFQLRNPVTDEPVGEVREMTRPALYGCVMGMAYVGSGGSADDPELREKVMDEFPILGMGGAPQRGTPQPLYQLSQWIIRNFDSGNGTHEEIADAMGAAAICGEWQPR